MRIETQVVYRTKIDKICISVCTWYRALCMSVADVNGKVCAGHDWITGISLINLSELNRSCTSPGFRMIDCNECGEPWRA